MKTEGFQCLTCDSEVIESLEELERQELEASLRGPIALLASSLPSLPGALRRHIPRWPIPQTAAGLLFGFWVTQQGAITKPPC